MKVVITGCCGFIGYWLTSTILSMGYEVIGIDNLSHPGAKIRYKRMTSWKNFMLYHNGLPPIDVSDRREIFRIFKSESDIKAVFHLAAQTAVTKSYEDREKDFDSNALGSFNIIEAVKRYCPDAYCLYASTNKVYGKISIKQPIGTDYPVSPYTPYGVSKYIGELYFTEYGTKELGLKTCSLRQSCVYGSNQFGLEDQGWLAWFAIANLYDKPLTIYGNGKQVRDLLSVHDLTKLYIRAWQKELTGSYPVGGGKENAVSLNEAIKLIEDITDKKFSEIRHEKARPGDQPYFVADNSWAKKKLKWQPRDDYEKGLKMLINWAAMNQSEMREVLR